MAGLQLQLAAIPEGMSLALLDLGGQTAGTGGRGRTTLYAYAVTLARLPRARLSPASATLGHRLPDDHWKVGLARHCLNTPVNGASLPVVRREWFAPPLKWLTEGVSQSLLAN
jgi:hypothetical protein